MLFQESHGITLNGSGPSFPNTFVISKAPMCVSFGNIRGQLLGALGMVQADLAKTTQRQIRTRRRAERTERDLRCSSFALCHWPNRFLDLRAP